MNRFSAGIAALLLVSAALICIRCNSGDGEKTYAKPDKATTLVVFSQGSDKTPWDQMYAKQMADAASQHQDDFTYTALDAQGDAQTQIKQIQDAVAKKPKVLMVSPVSDAVYPAISDAKKAGVEVFLLDQADHPSDADMDISINYPDVGVQMVGLTEFQFKKAKIKTGTILVIPPAGEPAGSAHAWRVDELMKGIVQRSDYSRKAVHRVVGTCKDTEADAKAFVASYLAAKKPVNIIYALDAETTQGAVEAVKEAKSNVKIYGVGAADKKVIDEVRDGSLADAIADFPAGPVALNFALNFAEGKKVPKQSAVPNDFVEIQGVDSFLKQHPILGD
jgi:ABC-type sugar transport system substrate-binding protein